MAIGTWHSTLKTKSFSPKLEIFKDQFENHNITNFSSFIKCKFTGGFNMEFFIQILDSLLLEFNYRFDNDLTDFFQNCSSILTDRFNFQ